MSSLSFPYSLFRRPGTARFSFLDLLLILLGAGIAYWLVPGLTEGIGY